MGEGDGGGKGGGKLAKVKGRERNDVLGAGGRGVVGGRIGVGGINAYWWRAICSPAKSRRVDAVAFRGSCWGPWGL